MVTEHECWQINYNSKVSILLLDIIMLSTGGSKQRCFEREGLEKDAFARIVQRAIVEAETSGWG